MSDYPTDTRDCTGLCPLGKHLHYRDGWFFHAKGRECSPSLNQRLAEKRGDSLLQGRLKGYLTKFRAALERLSK